jgi:hypothetical protein
MATGATDGDAQAGGGCGKSSVSWADRLEPPSMRVERNLAPVLESTARRLV